MSPLTTSSASLMPSCERVELHRYRAPLKTFELVLCCYRSMDERDWSGLRVILADPFAFESSNPAKSDRDGRRDAADLLVLLHHDGADAVTTSIDEILGGGQTVATVGWTNRASERQAISEVRVFAHHWHSVGEYLSAWRRPIWAWRSRRLPVA